MGPFRRLADYVKRDMWRPDERRVLVRRLRPGIGWSVNLAALRRGRRQGK